MTDPIVLRAGEGEVVGDSPDRRVEILSDCDPLHATWSRFGPGREGADLHVHRRHTDLFYVLEGELTLRLGPEGEPAVVGAGTLARVPPLVVHGFRNASGAELRYLNLHAPGRGFAGYMRGLRDGHAVPCDQEPPPPDGGRTPADAVIGGAGTAADGSILHADVEDLRLSEVTRRPGGPPSPRVEHDQVESFYVLEGDMALAAGDRELVAGPGTWIQVPAGVAHAVSVAGPAPVRFLQLRTPGAGSSPTGPA